MIVLEKKMSNTKVRYIITDGKVYRDMPDGQEEIENLYNLFLYSNFHNAYPLNPDYTVALSLQKLGWGEIVEYDTPIRSSDVVYEIPKK